MNTWLPVLPPVTTIYSHSVLAEARNLEVDLEDVEKELAACGEPILRYPDGSLQVEGPASSALAELRIGAAVQKALDLRVFQGAAGVWFGSTGYREISGFPERIYNVLVWGSFVSKNDGRFVTVHPGSPNAQVRNPTSSMENLLVTIVFTRKMSKRVRLSLLQVLSTWLDSVRHEGVSNEGQVRPTGSSLRFFDRLVQFRLDASRSGQMTVNWLILTLIDFCSQALISEVYFTERHDQYFSFEEEYALKDSLLMDVPWPHGIGKTD